MRPTGSNYPVKRYPRGDNDPPPTSRLSSADLTELLDHGDFLLRNGDVASARLFTSAVPVTGGQHCPSKRLSIRSFSVASALVSCKPIRPRHQSWYTRALDLGAVDAKRLNSFETRQGR